MVVRWQFWFLLSFVIIASWSLFGTMTSFSEGERQGERNWAYVVSKGYPDMRAYCDKSGVFQEGREPSPKTLDIFEPEDNPLFCSASLEEARHSYGLYVQTRARTSSMKLTFSFIGVWIAILLFLALTGRLVNRRKTPA